MEKTYEVKGMTCVMCKNNVEKTINKMKGVENGRVNLLENELTVSFDETVVSEKEMADAVKAAGYEMVLDKEKKVDTEKIRLILSIIISLTVMYFSMGHMIHLPQPEHSLSLLIQGVMALLALIINRHYYRGALMSVKNRILNMDVLVSLSTLASFVYSLFASYRILNGDHSYHVYFETAAMIITFVSIGKFIEGNTKARTGKVIRGLATLIPMQTTIIREDGETAVIPIAELKKNDICLIRAGDSIPQDGIVIAGYSQVDESMITGESLPVNKQTDDEVIGGTINQNGTLQIKITKRANQTVLSNIISLTKEATMKKIPIERFADTVSRYFVIAVISISLITFLIWMVLSKDFEKSLNFAICVLVVSCPCALGLATPSAIAVASGVGARNGILIKDPKILEVAGRLKTVIFDKTGTLTMNRLSINEVLENSSEMKAAAVALEKNSSHPIANAVIEAFSDDNLIPLTFDRVEEISGEGICGYCENNIYTAGNRRLMDRFGVSIPESETEKAKTNGYSMVMIAKNSELLGIIYLSDTVRVESLSAISQLKNRSIEPVMCTGDNEIAARKMAAYTGISSFLFEVKPKEKEELVHERKKNGAVAMVGDGINDAIALSSADVSFTIASGSDIASASSDVILMKNDLSDIAFTYDLSKKTMTIIKENLFWALFYNSIFIPVAAGALSSRGIVLTPMFGALAMSVSSIFVLGNALRINTIKKKEK